jgi:signal transduction histidine kinase
MRSLLAPLLAGLVLSLTAVFGVQWSMFRAEFDAMIVDYIAHELTQDAEEILGSLTVLRSGEATLALTHFDPPFLQPHSGRYFQILVDDGAVLRSPSLGGETLTIPAVNRGRRRVTHVAGPRNQDLLISAVGYEFAGRQVTIGVAADLNPVRSQFQRLLTHYSRVSVIMFALLVALQVAIVRLALGTLRRVKTDVGRLERGEITQLGERVPAEVLPLVREINRLLALLTRRLQRSRESLGDLAHALKTPLTVLQHMADDDEFQRDPELARQMAEQVKILRSRIDRELRRARVAGGRSSGTPVAVAKEIDALAQTLRKLHRERDLDIACRIDPDATFSGDREDFMELCGNLLDNACKWARSRVRVTVRDGGALALTVEDDGPGCSPEDLERIARRGVRLDETTEGHGLGLAIVDSIASSYDAELDFGRSPELGGFAVTVSFPATR